MKKSWLALWAPLFLGLYPLAHLYSVNLDRVEVGSLADPLLPTLLSTGLVLLVCGLLVREVEGTAIAASSFLFSYLVARTVQQSVIPSLAETGLAKALEIACALLSAAVAYGLTRAFRQSLDRSPWRMGMWGIAVSSLVLPIYRVAIVRHAHPARVPSAPYVAPVAADELRPDIYFIVLDGYARADILKNNFNYDNGPFLKSLQKQGFYIAENSTSNYAYTMLSLTSEMNMGYLDDVDGRADQVETCLSRLKYNRVLMLFKENGYRIVHFASGWFTDASPYADEVHHFNGLDEFNMLLWRNLPLGVFYRQKSLNANRLRILSTFKSLGQVHITPQPTFFFVHIIAPHPPFVFDREGNLPPPRDFGVRPPGARDWFPKERYVDQLDFISRQASAVVQQILARSKKRPIIILQSDHGPACDGTSAHPTELMVHERMAILNALYVPDEIRARLYPTMTPVNTFRIIAGDLLHQLVPLLPDRNYYAGPMDMLPYHFVDVTAMEQPAAKAVAR